MPDPASIIGLAQTVITVSFKVYSFFKSVHDAPREVRDFLTELEDLRKILPSIGISAAKLHDTFAYDQSNTAPDLIFVTLTACEAEFNSIWLEIKPFEAQRNLKWHEYLEKFGKSVQWVLSVDEIEKSVRRLGRMKQNLGLVMVTCGLDNDAVVLQTLLVVRDYVDENNKLIEARTKNLEKILLVGMQQFQHNAFAWVNDLQLLAADQQRQSRQQIEDLPDLLPSDFNRPQRSEDVSSQLFSPQNGGKSDCEASLLSNNRIEYLLAKEDSQEASPNMNPVRNNNTADFTAVTGPTLASNQNSAFIQGPVDLKLEEELARRVAGFMETISKKHRTQLARSVTTWSDVEMAVSETSAGLKKGSNEHTGRIAKMAEQLVGKGTAFASVFDVFLECSPALPIVYGGLQLILKAANGKLEETEMIMEGLVELGEAAEACQREYELYPVAKLRVLITKLYGEMLSFTEGALHHYSRRRPLITDRLREGDLPKVLAKAKKISQQIIMEVEYQHRKELKDAHRRLRLIDQKQDQVLRVMDAQQRILVSLQQEQKIMTVISDQQKILQLLQQIQLRFPQVAREVTAEDRIEV